MHDLPPEVEALLAGARSAQLEPDLHTRERVKRGVAVALTAGVLTSGAAHVSAQAAAKTWFAGSLAAKITGVSLLSAVATAVVVAPKFLDHSAAPASATTQSTRKVPRPPEPAARANEPPPLAENAPDAAQPTASLSQSGADAAAPSTNDPAGPASAPPGADDGSDQPDLRGATAELDPAFADALRAARSLPARGSLTAELVLLDQASQALTRGDPARARALLLQHRARFPRPILVEERDGLELIARCRLEPERARADAQAYLARAAHSVLSAGVERACRRKE